MGGEVQHLWMSPPLYCVEMMSRVEFSTLLRHFLRALSMPAVVDTLANQRVALVVEPAPPADAMAPHFFLGGC
jgi:hypothetical protein